MGRRIAARRLQLGLSRQDVALRAGAAPGYIEYVEEQPATPGIGFLLRLADALRTTVQELSGSTGDLPPGFGRGARRARMVELDEALCRTLLGDHGRRTGCPDQHLVVDRQHDRSVLQNAFSKGWSVLIVGTVRSVADEEAAQRLRETAYSTPWAGEEREHVMLLGARRVTGRKILVPDAPGDAD
ncbi:helix-turn-helix domain-containing protein [Streptomyces globisporus]|nr:helix-turn-helix domain-containing protein [Streptomyces globisporus]